MRSFTLERSPRSDGSATAEMSPANRGVPATKIVVLGRREKMMMMPCEILRSRSAEETNNRINY